ncbi:MAG TPA: NTP transferase domain-containing protein [Candidatus Pelethomonas intestinigallinarum]|nr:NTP transferase domain-containing protein [Candidatus Pelethomonas intestinigallinarum]
MNKPVLVVLAAGMGSRYGGLKQMDSVAGHGQSIIDYSIYDARRAGFEKVIFVIKRALEEDFRRLVGDRIARGIQVEYAFQELDDLPAGYAVPAGRKKPWGTTHAVLAARDLIRGPFAVINSDDYYGPEAFRLIYDFLSTQDEAAVPQRYAMVSYLLGNTVTDNGSVARGVCRVGEDGLLREVVEHTRIEKDGSDARSTLDGGETWVPLPGSTPVSMNFWGFQRSFVDEGEARFPEFLDRILAENPEKGEFYLPLLVSRLIGEGKAQVQVLPSEDKWYGVTYREDKPGVVAALADMTARGLYPENLWGV